MSRKYSHLFPVLICIIISCSGNDSQQSIFANNSAELQDTVPQTRVDSAFISIDVSGSQKTFFQYQDEFGNQFDLHEGRQAIPIPTIIREASQKIYFPITGGEAVLFNKKDSVWKAYANNNLTENSLNLFLKFNKEFSFSKEISRENNFSSPEQLSDFQKRENDIKVSVGNKLKKLDQYNQLDPMTLRNYNIWKNIIKYEVLGQAYFGIAGIAEKISKPNLEILKAQVNVYFNNDELLFIPDYKRAALHASRIISYLETGNKTPLIEEYYNSIFKNFSGKTRDILIAKILSEPEVYFKKYTEKDLKKAIERYVREGTTKEYKIYVLRSNEYNNYTLSAKELFNLNDESNSLSSITERATITYLDIWASWCGPCRAEMPASIKLKVDYKDRGVQFVYISIDSNPAAWERASKQVGLLDSESYLIPNIKNSFVVNQFKIKEIPRYMILDSAGKVLDANAPRPSDPSIREVLNKALSR